MLKFSIHTGKTIVLFHIVAFTMVAEAKQKISVAIISPYRAQVRLLRKWLRQEQKAENSPYLNVEIESGTVHQFQGSDADVVIFADAFNRWFEPENLRAAIRVRAGSPMNE